MSWIGIDLDGTLARVDQPFDGSIGEPIPSMVDFALSLILRGKDVRIFTARVAGTGLTNTHGVQDSGAFVLGQRKAIQAWCLKHLGRVLPITATKDFECEAIFDDIAHHVTTNASYRSGLPDRAQARRLGEDLKAFADSIGEENLGAFADDLCDAVWVHSETKDALPDFFEDWVATIEILEDVPNLPELMKEPTFPLKENE